MNTNEELQARPLGQQPRESECTAEAARYFHDEGWNAAIAALARQEEGREAGVERGLPTDRRMKAVELLLSQGYRWSEGEWIAPATPQAAGVSEETRAYLSELYADESKHAGKGYSKVERNLRALHELLALTAAGAAPEGWQPKAQELLDRLAKASPPNVLHQQLTILGDMAALLRCMYPQQPGAQHGQEGR